MQHIFQTKKDLREFHLAILVDAHLFETGMFTNFFFTRSNQAFADFIIFGHELLPARQLFSTLQPPKSLQ